MKNTLIINVNSGYDLEHISTVNDGTDRLILQLKCDASAGVRVNNAVGSLNVVADNDNFLLEISKPLWIGLGAETITITVGEGAEAVSYPLTINKTPACGGNYQAGKVSDTEFYFSKVKDTFSEVHYPEQEQIVGTWHNGKPIYRRFIQIEKYENASSSFTRTIDVQSLQIDDLINADGYVRRSASGNEGMLYFAKAYSSYFEVKTLAVGVLRGPQKGVTVQVYWTGYYTIWIDYTKTTDMATDISEVQPSGGELKDEFTLVWEGDINADMLVNLSESMLLHKQIAFEVSGQAVTAATQYNTLYRIPTQLFKNLYDNEASPLSKYILSYYDNYNDLFTYVSETVFLFDFVTTQRLRRVWFVD